MLAGVALWTAPWLGTKGMLASLLTEFCGEGVRAENPLVLRLTIGSNVVVALLARLAGPLGRLSPRA